MRIPRPDLSLKLGIPNACTHCHDEKTDEWALQNVNKWYGEKRKPHYGSILADAAGGIAGADSGLLRIINSNLYPEIIRATAIGYLSSYPGPVAQAVVKKTCGDPDPLLRFTAVENFMPNDSSELFRTISPLLDDPIKAVRMQAAYRLSTFRKETFNEIQHRLFLKALEEYRNAQEYVADFPSGRYNLGNFYAKMKNLPKAEENYREAIRIDDLFYPAKANLVLIYYQEGKTDSVVKLCQDMITKNPESSDGYYYLALLYGEQKRYTEAIGLLVTASTRARSNTRILYNLGLLYQMTGQNEKCEATLVKGLKTDPCNFELLYALYAFHMNRNEHEKARPYMERMMICFPDEKQVRQIYEAFVRK